MISLNFQRVVSLFLFSFLLFSCSSEAIEEIPEETPAIDLVEADVEDDLNYPENNNDIPDSQTIIQEETDLERQAREEQEQIDKNYAETGYPETDLERQAREEQEILDSEREDNYLETGLRETNTERSEREAQEAAEKEAQELAIKNNPDFSQKIYDSQLLLRELNLYTGDINGLNSIETTEAVKLFQKKSCLTTDGIIGPITLRALQLGEDSYVDENQCSPCINPSSQTVAYKCGFDKNMYTFENLWKSVFDGTAKFFPLPWIDANESPNLLNIKKDQGRSIIGVFDGDLSNDNGYGRCGHGKCILNVIEKFYPEASIQAWSWGSLFDKAASNFGADESYVLDLVYEVNSENGFFTTRGSDDYYLMMISFMHQNHNDKAKVFTLSTSSGDAFKESRLDTTYDYFSTNPETRNRYSWSYKQTRIGTKLMENGKFEIARYLESKKNDLNTLVVGSIENSFILNDGSNDSCVHYDHTTRYDWLLYGSYTPQCGTLEDAIFMTGNFESHWLLVGYAAPNSNEVLSVVPGPYYEDNIVYVRGNFIDSSTSFSTPIVAALAAKVIDTNPSLTAAEVKKIIINSSDMTNASRLKSLQNGVQINETVRVPIVNWDSAISCATSLSCLNN